MSRLSNAVSSRFRPGIALALAGLLAGVHSPARADGSPAQPDSPTPAAAGQSSPSILPEIERRLRELEEEVKELRRERDEKARAAAPAAAGLAGQKGGEEKKEGGEEKKAGGDEEGDEEKPPAGFQNGFFIQSPDGNFKLGLHALIQTQFRTYTSERGRTGLTNFFMRRARPIIDGSVYRVFDFRLVPDFGVGKVQLFDAYVDYHQYREASLRFGKFKSPFSLERLQSAPDLVFIERSIGNNLSPNRDIGTMLFGEALKGAVTYQLAGLDGAPDNSGASLDSDPDGNKDVAARVFLQPFVKQKGSLLRGLGFGSGMTYGGRDMTPAPTYSTAGRATFFTWAKGVVEDGPQLRISPQAYYYHGPFGIMGEWLRSSQELLLNGMHRRFNNESWFAQASCVLTGEENSYKSVTPRRNFNPKEGTWGAFELGARYSRLAVDPGFFTLKFADPKASAQNAHEFTVGLNWYINRALKLQTDWQHTVFDHGILFPPGIRSQEDLFLSQMQLNF